MTTYRWHYDIPVRNAFDPDRLASVLLPAEQDAPAELSVDNLDVLFPDGYQQHGYVSFVASIPTVYVATPRGLLPCTVCDMALKAQADPDCPECGGRGYVEVES